MPRLLLTSVVRPALATELFHSQITLAQGPFSPRQVVRCWALDYLAENVECPAVVLHYPSEDELVRELCELQPTHVGINFVVPTFAAVRRMCELVRTHAPTAKIVLGGYGTVLPDELLSPIADEICRQEGISFLRSLLGERVDRPIIAPHAPISSPSILSMQPASVVGHVTAGLGCPNGCDFCSTSQYFGRRYQRFCHSGRDIYEALLATRRRAERDGVEMTSFILIDEDFFLHEKRAREFLACVREGGEALSIMGFGSTRGLSKFTPREVAEMGFELVWNGFEGRRAGYGKLRGKPLPELYRGLRSVGCALLSSMIIGFPYQDTAVIREELDELLELEPAMMQCLIQFAFPGTPLFDEAIARRRHRASLQDGIDLQTFDGFSAHFDHPNFDSPEALEALQKEVYRLDFERLGPSIMRMASVWLQGYRNLRYDASPGLRARAEVLRARARQVLPSLRTVARYAPSPAVLEAAMNLRRDLLRETGALSPRERALEAAGPALFRLSEALSRTGLFESPGLLRVLHRMPGAKESQHTSRVQKLHGARALGISELLRAGFSSRGRRAPPPSPVRVAPETLAHAPVPREAELSEPRRAVHPSEPAPLEPGPLLWTR